MRIWEVDIMEHSPKFEKVKSYYDAGFWTKKMVKTAADKGWITQEEYVKIEELMHYALSAPNKNEAK